MIIHAIAFNIATSTMATSLNLLEEDWDLVATGLYFTYVKGEKFKWRVLQSPNLQDIVQDQVYQDDQLKDVQDQYDWSDCYTGVGFTWSRGERFHWTPLPLGEIKKTWMSKSQRRKRAKKETKRRLALSNQRNN